MQTFQAHESADVVVIGGGIIGLAIARELARKRIASVTIVERAELGSEASFAAAGMLAPQAEADAADEFFQLCCRSRDLYPAFSRSLFEETGIDIELDLTGTLYCAFTENDWEEIEHRYEWQSRSGLAVQRLDAQAARELEPNISESVAAALKFPRDWQVENRFLLKALVAANKKLGVRLETNTSVAAIRVEQGQVAGVETAAGFVSSRNVVLAGGAWTSSIKTDGVLPQFRIEPVRGQMVCFNAKSADTHHVIYSPRGYVVPRLDGRLLAGSTTEEVGFDKGVTTAGVQRIVSHASEIMPRICELPIADTWAGLRPRAPDGLPVMGRDRETKGLYYATGHYRNGILLAPISGELIGSLIADNVVSPQLGAFAPDRFALVGVN